MFKKNKLFFLLFFLSFINWIPSLNIIFRIISIDKIGLLTLGAWFVTPVIAVIYSIIALMLLLKKKINWLLGSILIAINLVYLFWGFEYLGIIIYSA